VGNFYVDAMLVILHEAGCTTGVNDINQGWERRSRSSGGFDNDRSILGIQWHHTASSASINSDLSYMINGSPDKPVGNVLLDRNGVFWPVAAGAANTSGKGGPSLFSRGTVPLDKGNTSLFSIEIANNGVGERYTQAQIDACFLGSNALNSYFGNQPSDVITHALGEGDGYTSRKIDPATTNIEGPWWPASVNSSGTWRLTDLKNECVRRASALPPPNPIPPVEDDVSNVLVLEDARNGAWYRVGPDSKSWVRDGHMAEQLNARLAETAQFGVAQDGFRYVKMRNGDVNFIRSCGPIVGPVPAGVDEYGG
jgi:N-acetylmuramoyl-L-alanine amidase